MRIFVWGDPDLAQELRLLLMRADLVVAMERPKLLTTLCYSVKLESGEALAVDSVDCELDRRIRACIGEITKTDIIVRHSGGDIFSDQAIKITVPKSEREAVLTGIRRGLGLIMPLTYAPAEIIPIPISPRLPLRARAALAAAACIALLVIGYAFTLGFS